jgi:hypothetical protein
VKAPVKLTIFALGLVTLAGGGAVAGGAADPERREEPSPHTEPQESEAGRGEESAHAEDATAHPVRGVAVAENGLRLDVTDPELSRGRTETLRFRIVDDGGRTVRDFDVEHTRRMHVIVARRDLSGFQHLHPKQSRDGSWSLPLTLDEPGSYRLFADFSHEGEKTTLATDLRVDGAADLRPLPAPAATSVSDGGYDVRLDAGRVRPGAEAQLRFTISKGARAAPR